MIRDEIIKLARSYIGTPFVHKGRSHKGVDCVGLLYVIFKPIFDIPNPTDYKPRVTSMSSFMKIRQYADRIKANEAGPGDIVLMCIDNNSAHYGLLTDTTIIHADQSIGYVIEHNKNHLDKRIVAFFRMKGMDPWVKLDA